MTANELADWIENGAPFGDYETAKQASAMLRQQQAEIEALRNHRAWIKETAVKELTDREIMELYCVTSDNDPLEFARAILKKVREK